MTAAMICINDSDTVTSWHDVGRCEGLQNDNLIAKFLIKLYLKASQNVALNNTNSTHCSHCLLSPTLQQLRSGKHNKISDNHDTASINHHGSDSDENLQASDTENMDEVLDSTGHGQISDVALNNAADTDFLSAQTRPVHHISRKEFSKKAVTSGEMVLSLEVKEEDCDMIYSSHSRNIWMELQKVKACDKNSYSSSLEDRAMNSCDVEELLGMDHVIESCPKPSTGTKRISTAISNTTESSTVSKTPVQNLTPSNAPAVIPKASLNSPLETESSQTLTNSVTGSAILVSTQQDTQEESENSLQHDFVDVLKRDNIEEYCGPADDTSIQDDLYQAGQRNLTVSQSHMTKTKASDIDSGDDLNKQDLLEEDGEKKLKTLKQESRGVKYRRQTDMKRETRRAHVVRGKSVFSWRKSGSAHNRQRDLKNRNRFPTTAPNSVCSLKTCEDPLVCPVCKKRFSHKKTLRCHMFIHTGEKPYVCSVCNAQFRQSSNLRNHLKTIHTTEKQIMCSHCPFACKTNKSLKQHILLRHSGPLERTFQCAECMASFVTKSHLQRHELTHSGEKPYVCEDCGQAFSQKCNLKKHVAGAHRKALDGSPIKSMTKFMCDVCGKTFFARTSLVQHKARHTTARPYKCELCPKSFKTKPVLKQHHRNLHSVSGPYPCKACEKMFGTKAALNSHMKIHSANRTFVCETCGKAFRTQPRLMSHETTHSESRPITCDVCEKTFKTKFALSQHRQRHSANTEFLCETCGKAFKTRRSLRLHEATHSDSRIHSCELCDKSFKTKIALHSHKVSHSVNKNFVCETCGKAFKRRCELKKHETRHSDSRPHVCEVCEKSFKTKYCLHSHRLTHTVSKDFVCGTCGKVYKSRPSLLNHEATHSDKRPHTCEICEKSFISGPSLKRHLLLHSRSHVVKIPENVKPAPVEPFKTYHVLNKAQAYDSHQCPDQ